MLDVKWFLFVLYVLRTFIFTVYRYSRSFHSILLVTSFAIPAGIDIEEDPNLPSLFLYFYILIAT